MMKLVEPVAKTVPDARMLYHSYHRCDVALFWRIDEVVVDDVVALKSWISNKGQR